MAASPRAVFLTESNAAPPPQSLSAYGGRRASVRLTVTQASGVGGGEGGDGPITFAKIRLRNAVKKITKMQTSTSKFEFPTLDTVRMPKLKRFDDQQPGPSSSGVNLGGTRADVGSSSSPLAHDVSMDGIPVHDDILPDIPHTASIQTFRRHSPSRGSPPDSRRHRSNNKLFEYINPTYPAQTPVSDIVEAVLDKQPVQVLDRMTKQVIEWWTGPDARDLLLDIFWITVASLRQQSMLIPDFEFIFHHHLAVTFGEAFSKLTDTVVLGPISSDGAGTRETVFDLFPSLSCQITYFALTHVFPHDVEKAVFSGNFCRSMYQRVHFWTTGVVPQVANTRHWQPSPRHAKALARSGTGATVDKQAEAQRTRLKNKTTFHRAMLHRSASRGSFTREVTDAIRPPEPELSDDIAKALNRSKNKNDTGDFVPVRHSGAGRWYEQGFPRGFLSTQRVDEYEMSGARMIDLTFPLMPEVNPLTMVGGAKGDEDRETLPKIRLPGKASNRTASVARNEALHNSTSSAVVEHATNAARRGSFAAASIVASLNATSEANVYASPEFVEASKFLLRGLDTARVPDDVNVTTEVDRTASLGEIARMQQSLHAVGHSEMEKRMDVEFVLAERKRRRGVLPSHAPLMLYYMERVLGMASIHHPVGRPVPFTKLSELDRTTKGARFTTYAMESVKTAELVLKANEDAVEAGRRREQRDKELLREQEKKWRNKLKYAAQLLAVKASPRSEEHTVLAAEAAKQLRDALYERGKDIHTIIARYDAALERAKIMFSLPYALRKLLWDLGLQCKLRLLFWQRSAPHNFMTVKHEFDEKGVAMLNDLVERISTRRTDLAGKLTRSWEERSDIAHDAVSDDGTVENDATLWGLRVDEVLGANTQAYGHAETKIASARGGASAAQTATPDSKATTAGGAAYATQPWSYARMVAEMERRRAAEREAQAFSGQVDHFIHASMQRHRTDDDDTASAVAEEESTAAQSVRETPALSSNPYGHLGDADLLAAMHRTRRTDEEEARRAAHQTRLLLQRLNDDPECDPTLASGIAMRHGTAVVGANNLVNHNAVGVVANSNEAPKQHYEEVDDDRVGKYLESKLLIALGGKKKEKPQWQRTWVVKEGEELTTQPPLFDPATIMATQAEVKSRRANMPNPVSAHIKSSPRGLSGSPTFDATVTSMDDSPFLVASRAAAAAASGAAGASSPLSPTARGAQARQHHGAAPRPPDMPLLPSLQRPVAASLNATKTTDSLLPSLSETLHSSGAVVPPEVVNMLDTHSARRFEMATPPTTIAPSSTHFKGRLGASMRSGAHTIHSLNVTSPKLPPTSPLTARATRDTVSGLPPLPPIPASARR